MRAWTRSAVRSGRGVSCGGEAQHECGAFGGWRGGDREAFVAELEVGLAVERFEVECFFEVDVAYLGAGGEPEVFDEQDALFVDGFGFDPVEFRCQDRADGVAFQSCQRECAHRGPVEVRGGVGPGVGFGLASVLFFGDRVEEVRCVPGERVACGLCLGDEVGGGFGDDGLSGFGEVVEQCGLAGAGGAGEDVAAQGGVSFRMRW